MDRFCHGLVVLLSCSVCLCGQSSSGDFQDVSARATAARKANDLPQAIELYRRAVQSNPSWQEGWWFLGSLLYDTDQYADARDALRRFIHLDPNAGPGLALLGLCEFETGGYTAALDHIQRALSLGAGSEPQMNQVLRFHEALLLTRAGDFDKALQRYAWLVRNGDSSNLLLTSIGIAALRKPMLPKDVHADQTDLFLTAGKAAALTMAGDVKAAQQTYQDLLARYPKASNVHYLYGCFLLGADPAKAIDELKNELAITPANPAAAAMLAWALLRRNDFKEGLPYAERAAREEPKFEIAQFVFGRLLVETGDVKRGIEHLQLAETLNPDDLEAHLSLVTAYSRIGRTEEARRERKLCLQMTKGASPVARP